MTHWITRIEAITLKSMYAHIFYKGYMDTCVECLKYSILYTLVEVLAHSFHRLHTMSDVALWQSLLRSLYIHHTLLEIKFCHALTHFLQYNVYAHAMYMINGFTIERLK